MSAALEPYDEPFAFDAFSDVPGYRALINRDLPPNIWNDDLERYQGVRGHLNLPGQVHLGAILASEKKLRKFDQCARRGKAGHGPSPRYIQHPHSQKWFRVALPPALDVFLTTLVRAENRGHVFSGNTPQKVYNDCRKWTAILRQLGIVISTSPVPVDDHGAGGNTGHRFAVHSRVVTVLPDGAELSDLFVEASRIVDEFRLFKLRQVREQGVKAQVNIARLCVSFTTFGEIPGGAEAA